MRSEVRGHGVLVMCLTGDSCSVVGCVCPQVLGGLGGRLRKALGASTVTNAERGIQMEMDYLD